MHRLFSLGSLVRILPPYSGTDRYGVGLIVGKEFGSLYWTVLTRGSVAAFHSYDLEVIQDIDSVQHPCE